MCGITVVHLGAATAGSYLAYVCATFIVTGLPQLVLAALTRVELSAFYANWALPRVVSRFPPEGSAPLYLLYQGGFLLSASGMWLLLSAMLRRRGGWSQIWLVHLVFWLSALFGLFLSGRIGWNGVSLNAMLMALHKGKAVSRISLVSLWMIGAAVALPAMYVGARRLAGVLAKRRWERAAAVAGWLVLPLAVVGAILNERLFRIRTPPGLSLTFAPALAAVVLGLPAALRSGNTPILPRPGIRGAGKLLALTGLVIVALLQYDNAARWVRRGTLHEFPGSHWTLLFENPGISPHRQVLLVREADLRWESASARLGLPPAASRPRLYFYATAGAKSLVTGNDRPFTVQGQRGEVHELLDPRGEVADPRGEALGLMMAAWGPPASLPVALAIARYAVGNFRGDPVEQYAARITHEEGPYALQELFRQGSEDLSILVRDPLGGTWAAWVAERGGAAALAEAYRRPPPLDAASEQKWHEFQLANASRFLPTPRARRPPRDFHRGVSFSHEFGGEVGYGSDRASQELRRIRETGATSIALVPYAFTRAPRGTRIQTATAERDDRVIRTIQEAKRLGLGVMLKPQLWSAGFTGDITFSTDEDFAIWFRAYRRWILNQARLAEMFDVDLLVIGTELGGTSRREAAWRSLIADVRRIYSGPLTYAASWGPDFETLGFWDALDFLGVNMYYPLAGPGEVPSPDSAQIRELIEKFAACARKHNKPIVFTEVGYPAKATAALRPWDSSDRSLDPELQARCYETAFAAFYRQPWLAGLYWWKWPSHGEGSRFDSSDSPLGKPAL